MFSHVMVGSNDIERSKTFYGALFAAIGGKPGRVDPKGRLSYLHKGAAFWCRSRSTGRRPAAPMAARLGFPGRAGTGRGLAQGRDGEWRRHVRGPARPPRRLVRPALPRLSPRPGREQAVRAVPDAGLRSGGW